MVCSDCGTPVIDMSKIIAGKKLRQTQCPNAGCVITGVTNWVDVTDVDKNGVILDGAVKR